MERILESIDIPHITTTVLEYLPRVGLALVLLAVFHLLYRITRIPLSAALKKAEFHSTLIDLITGKLYKYMMMVVALVMAADQLGVNVGTALAGLGVAGIAVGFAAQDSVANVISGILIFWDKPFLVGDWIKTEGHYGRVSNITLRSTRIMTPRNTFVVIPNKRIIDEVMENYSKHGDIRVDVPLGIAYKEDIPAARRTLLAAVSGIEGLRTSRPSDVVVTQLGDSSVNLDIRVWIPDAEDQQSTFARVLEAAKIALDAAGIEIPFPHLQLFVDEIREPVWEGATKLKAAGGDQG
jgi:small conductance mechanosensitive channel